MTEIAVSVILPCFRSTPVALRTAEVLAAYLPTVFPTWELIVVDDGENEFGTAPLPDADNVRLITHSRNLGKGAAVRTGMLAARGRIRIFTDIDMPYDRELLPVLADYIDRSGFHLVIGDRTLPGSHYAAATSPARRMLSAVASRVIGSLVTGGFFDTQCGIKAMRGDVADALFPMIRTRRFAFDVEIVYLALKHGLDVKRVPVHLRRNLESSVRPFPDAVRSAIDILAIKLRQLRREYDNPELAAIIFDEHARALARNHSLPTSAPTDRSESTR
ncbi:MAG TPA: glycosyltransferase [Gemmatimonadales bacterium]